ncbi:hypothetical protein AAU61_07890 [Desulfocarbo indianensis]|nr:hypothetical protein AAU61_07890 [Desulfocarbo indianensis]
MLAKLLHALCITFAALALAGAAGAVDTSPSAEKVRGQAEQAVEVRVQTQKKVETLAAQEAELAQAVETQSRELALVTRQREKTEAFLKDQRQKLAEMQRQQKEMARIRAELEPFLDQTFAQLSGFVAADLPFLVSEREERLTTLGNLLNNFDASLPDKTRRLLAALEIEARYGATAQAEERELEISGRKLRVRVLRLGRLGLFAISPDGRQAWRYDRQAKAFSPVDDYSRALNQAADIAQRHRVATLIEVPLGVLPAREVKP